MRIPKSLLLLSTAFVFSLNASAQKTNVHYPKEITSSQKEIITIYQPQPESMNGNLVTGRAALSVRKTAKDEPVFGALFFEARIATDKNNRTASLVSMKVTNAKFPGIEDTTKLKRLINEIETEVPKWNMVISIDALVTSISAESATTKDEFNNSPPKIYYATKPTALVYIDKDPKIQKVKIDKDVEVERVVNTPSLILKDGDYFYLYSAGLWYKSESVLSGWKKTKKLPKKLKSVGEKVKEAEKKNNGGEEPKEDPTETEIIVSLAPAELLQTEGEPLFKIIQGTSLLYASNTSDQIFKDVNTQATYTLLSGRWYTAAKLEGPWTYVPSDKLPADFAKIPAGTDKDEVLANVAGTPEAEEAKIDAQIPQTAKVDRKTAKIDVKYDGTPKFSKIEGTALELAENANVTVLKEENKYYAVENGVWFSAPAATGPWSVSDERPKDVSKIPASSSAYNTKYVYVYESTPEVVYVGYTPGYMGCYVYGPTVVYGTGFYYAPWYGAAYYPRPVTWGFGMSYNPWYGWSMSVGFSTGYMHVGFSFGMGGGWYGPPMYYPPYRPPYYGGGYYPPGGYRPPGYNPPGYNPPGYGNRPNNPNRPSNQPSVGHFDNNRGNIYNNQAGVSTNDRQRPSQGGSSRPSAGQLPSQGGGNMRPSTANNNVYTDRQGNVYQRDNKGNWSQRDNKSNSWQPSTNNNMNRDAQARDRSNMRTNNYNQQRSMSRPSGGGGGMRGGGGGGRRR
ncbi:MAG: hypothetical protein C5B52_13825 [Bacteroidetes bacterium]|nr:MAG: hypothetical protein C5B52_13825 [Bacteroidota bacterium]